jgi:phage minor structural protein
MIPRLYAHDETDFTHNGIGLLSDTISATVTEEMNSTCELQLEYDVDGQFSDQIDDGMIIKAKANDKQDDQLFRIYKHVKDQADNKITIYAQHITYDLAQNFIESLELNSATTAEAMQAIQSSLAYSTRFMLSSDNTTTSSSTKLYRNNPLQMIAGVDGSILDNWGGEIERDNFNLTMRARRGTDDGVLVAYKKNLTGLTVTVDQSNLVTRIYPFKTLDDGTVLTVPGKYVDSPHINDYDHIYIQAVDYSSDEDVTDQASLEAKSAQWFTNNSGIDKPTITMDVTFEPLWATEEYKMVKMLEFVSMGDTIYIKNSHLVIDGSARIIKIVYDTLAEKNAQVTAGDAKATLEDKVSAIATVNTKADTALTLAGYAIANADGTTTIYAADEPTGHYKAGSLWFKIVDGTYTRMYRYDGIQWVLIKSADANDALNKAIDALTAANGKNTVYHQAAQPIAGNNQDIWFRENADGTVTIFVYQDGQWVNPIQDGVKAAQDQADTAVATADAASAQASNALNTANSASGQAATALNTANAANSAAQAAQQTAGDAATQASNAWNKAQDAWDEAQTKADTDNVYTKEETDQALTGYASTTTVNTLTGRVDQAETAISENENEISLKADASTVNALSGRVSTAEATLTTQANQIAARITSQDADAKYATQTALTATSSSLTSSIASVRTDFDNLQIGGRNYVLGSSFDSLPNGATAFGPCSLSVVYDSSKNSNVLKVTTDGSSNAQGPILYGLSNPLDTAGTNVASGVWMKADSNGQIEWGKEDSGSHLVNVTTEWQYFEFSGVIYSDQMYHAYRFYSQGGSNFYIYHPMLVVGTKAPDWQPAPEDMATAVQFTSISQTLTGFQTTVQQDYATKSLVTQTAQSLQSSIDGKVGSDIYNSKVSQLSNDINLRVSKNDVINQINVSTEGILIDGSNVHITGQTTIDDAVIQSAMIASMDAGKITTGMLSANRIASKSITVDKLDVANLAAISQNVGTITAGSLNSVNINAANITGTTISGSQINGESITSGIISSDRIAANSIKTQQINVGDFTNLCINPNFQDSYGNVSGAGWGWSFQWPSTGDGGSPSKYYGGFRGRDGFCGDWFTVTPGEKFYCSMFSWLDGGSSFNGNFNLGLISDDGNGGNTNWFVGCNNWDGQHRSTEGILTIPNGYIRAKVWVQIDANDNFPLWWATSIVVRRAMKGNLIVDGTIQGVTINGNTINGGTINGTQLNGSNFYQNANGFQTWLDGNGFHQQWGNDTHAWIRNGGINVSYSPTNEYVDIIPNRINVHGEGGGNTDITGYAVYSQAFNNNSREELKTEITTLDDSIGLALVNNLDIYKFKYKSEVASGRAKYIYGGIIGDGYRLPDDFKDFADQGVNLYSSTFIGLKAIQELTALHQQDILKIANLESTVATQQLQINDLMQQNSDLRDRVQLLEAA